jgi:pimeloyl-ACP methyl ester carboxylesterase
MTITDAGCVAGLEPTRGEVHAGGIDLSYLEWGHSGTSVVLLHGITSSARGWWRVAPELAQHGYHVYALDLPGHGQSQLLGEHRIDRISTLVAEALVTLNLDTPALIGHSWGGAVALTVARSIAVARLVLVDPLLGMSSERSRLLLPSFLEGVGLPPEQTLPALRAVNPNWHECDFVWKGEALQQCRAEAVHGLFSTGDWQITQLLGQVDVPLLLLLADPQYTILGPELLTAAQASIRPGLGEIVPVAGTNHNMFRAGFTPFMQVLLPWLQNNVKSSMV